MNKNYFKWIIAMVLLVSMISLASAEQYNNYLGDEEYVWNLNESTGSVAYSLGNLSEIGLNGTINNMEEQDWIPGRWGTALNFDGAGEIISVASTAGTAYTYLTWAVINSSGGIFQIPGAANIKMSALPDGSLSCRSDSGVANAYVTSIGFDWRDSNYHLVGCSDSGTTITVWVDGKVSNSLVDGAGGASGAQHDWGTNGTKTFNGTLEDIVFFKKVLTSNQVEQIYNQTLGTGLELFDANIPDNSQYNILTLNFNATMNSSLNATCLFNLDDVLNETTYYSAGNYTPINHTKTLADGTHNYSIVCTDNSGTSGTLGINTFYIDTINPIVNTNFTNKSIYTTKNVIFQLNMSDSQSLFSYNVSVNGVTKQSQDNILNTSWNVPINIAISGVPVGTNNMNIRVADGHTAKELIADYDVSNGLFNDYLEYEFKDPYKDGSLKIKQKESSLLDSWDTEKKIDRYSFKFQPWVKSTSYTFTVTAEEEIHIVDMPESKYLKWLIYDDHWLDFSPYTDVDIIRISDTEVEVTVNGVDINQEEITFNSIGDLNIVEIDYVFYRINITESYETTVIRGFDTTLTLNVSGLINHSYGTSLFWNHTTYNPSETFVDGNSIYSSTITTPIVDLESTISHNWVINTTNTSIQNQTILPVFFGECNSSQPYTIINMSYFDEVNDDPINLTNDYFLTFSDGVYSKNETGSFEESPVTSNRFCTNINPSNATFNVDIWGTMSLSKSNYVTRIINTPESGAFPSSNNPSYNLSMSMVSIANSSTLTYTWLTSNYVNVNGVMRIFKCNGDGSKTLAESVNIVGGQAVANIVPLTVAYSYEVIIEDVLYQQPSFYTCHVESQSERTFYIDVAGSDINEPIGLYSTFCSLTDQGSNVVNMTWGTNSQESSNITGCIEGYRHDLKGDVLVYSNCSDSQELLVTIPVNNGFDYTVKGYLKQESVGTTVYCADQIDYIDDRDAATQFGLSALLGIAFLILGVSLFYAGDNEIMLGAAVVAIVVAWVLGVMNLGWGVTSSMIAFIIGILIVGRYTRK